MARFGTDKPDLRFGMELVDVTAMFRDSDFRLFAEAARSGSLVKAIKAPGCAQYSRKDLDTLTEQVKAWGARGLATLAWTSAGLKGSIAKTLGEGNAAELRAQNGGR